MKTFKIEIEVTVDELPEVERNAIQAGMDAEDPALPRLEDTDPRDVAWLFNDLDGPGFNQLLFDGSDIFVMVTNIRVVTPFDEVEWVDESAALERGEP